MEVKSIAYINIYCIHSIKLIFYNLIILYIASNFKNNSKYKNYI